MNVKQCFLIIFLVIMILSITPQVIQASTLPVDEFDAVVSGLVVIANSGTPTASGTVDDPSIMGGERDIFVNYISGAGNVTARSVNPGGIFAHAQDPGIRGRTTLTWDGNDNDATTLDPIGLGGINLTNPTNDAFLLYLVSSDVNTQVRIRVYTDGVNWSEAIIAVTANTTGQLVAVPFTSFVMGTGASGPANFSNVGAIELRLNNAGLASLDLDMVIDFFKAADSNSYRDWGDLPDVYGTLLSSNGPRHLVSTLFLGAGVDDEGDGIPTGDATGDGNDEDGVSRLGVWSNGTPPLNGGQIAVTLSGPFPGCLAGWIDFNDNGNFTDPGEEIFFTADHQGTGLASNMAPINTGVNNLSFAIPAGTFPGPGGNLTFHARFRVIPDRNTDGLCIPQPVGGDEPSIASTGEYANGEVEDYVWGFTPTAISLQTLDILSPSSIFPIALTGILLAMVVSTGFVVYRRHRIV